MSGLRTIPLGPIGLTFVACHQPEEGPLFGMWEVTEGTFATTSSTYTTTLANEGTTESGCYYQYALRMACDGTGHAFLFTQYASVCEDEPESVAGYGWHGPYVQTGPRTYDFDFSGYPGNMGCDRQAETLACTIPAANVTLRFARVAEREDTPYWQP